MITQAAEYALRAVLLLATRTGEPLTNQQIATLAGIPGGYLAKVLQVLGRAGIVTSQRGLNGGFLLGVEPDRLTPMDVVRVVDASHRLATNGIEDAESPPNLCPLHTRIDAAIAAAEAELRACSFAELAAAHGDAPWCLHPDACAAANPVSKVVSR